MKRLLRRMWIVLVFPCILQAGIDGRFMQYPDIRGNDIVFTYENDVWMVKRSGGQAVRLTNHPGAEISPKISPDGRWIAFNGNYDGDNFIYVIPMGGGEPKRLTWQRSGRVIGWTPDSKKVIFRAVFENNYRPLMRLYAVSFDGETPEPLPIPQGVLASFSPDGKRMAYNPIGNEEYYWKRYKGGQHQTVWIADLEQKTYKKLTDYVGKNSYPMWIGNVIYFVTDCDESGIANLYRMDLATGKTDPVTRYRDYDVQMPSNDNTSIVFLHSGYLYCLDVVKGAADKINLTIPTDGWTIRERFVNPKDYIHSMSINDDGKTAVLEARGDVYLVPTEKNKQTRNVTQTGESRERYPQLSPNGKWVAFFSDKTGEYEIFIKPVEGEGEWTQLTDGLKTTSYHLEWSPDSDKILFGTREFAIFYIDIKTRKLTKIDSSNQMKNDEFYWEISDYGWSPDSRWVAYSFVQYNRNNKVFLYSLDQNKSFSVTNDFYDCLNPSFDANGEYLYFLSYRDYSVRMDVFEDNHVIANPVQVMAVQLKAGQKPPFGNPGSREKKTSSEPFRIDLEGIENRIFPLPVGSGNYFFLKAGKGMVTWASVDQFNEDEYEEIFTPGGQDKWDLHVFSLDKEEKVVLDKKISDWRLSANREHLLIRKRVDFHAQTVEKAFDSKGLGEKLNLDNMIYRVEPRQEWAQIFNDTWRWYRDFFYDKNMHGRDWKKMGEGYRAYLPQLTSRQDLNWLLSQMVGELCVSHTYIGGGDQGPRINVENPVSTGFLGADFEVDAINTLYRIKKIYGPTLYNAGLKGPLVSPDLDIREGDYILAIDGASVRPPENLFKHLQVIRSQKVKITVNRKPTAVGAKTFEIEPAANEYDLRYNRWLADNIEKVLSASHGDVGYMNITGMSSANVGQFDKFWRAFRYKKGLVIDVRGNGGGWTEYFIIDKLERKMTALNCLNGMVPFLYPGSISNGHLAVVTNETNGSDGEAFVEHFKARKLGIVVGVPSWGGLVGILNRQTTIDNGSVHQSNNAFYDESGKWLVENHGADPDVLVENDPTSLMAGHDKQLETAVDILLKKIKEQPYKLPEKPLYPIK